MSLPLSIAMDRVRQAFLTESSFGRGSSTYHFAESGSMESPCDKAAEAASLVVS
jgi:hypothetical protein